MREELLDCGFECRHGEASLALYQELLDLE